MARCLRERKEFRGEEIVIERPDGSRIFVQATATPYFDDRGELIGAVNVLVDITDRRRMEQQLRRSERELADFFDNAAVGLHWVGPDGTILRANRAELDLLGYAPEEYIGHHIAEFHADREVIEDILRRLRAGAELRDYEARMRCKDGTIKHVAISSNVLWEDGRFIHTRCFTRDVTDRKRTEETLRERETWLSGQGEALEAALNGAPLETALGVLVRTATGLLGPDVRAAFYLANPEGTALHHLVGMQPGYAEAVDGFPIGPESLSCGLAVHSGQPVLTPDVTREPVWEPWLWLAEKFDFRGCWSIPIHASARKYTGTLAIYWKQPHEATAREMEILTRVSQAAGIIISRHSEMEVRRRAEEALRRSEAQLQAELRDTKLLQSISAELIQEENVEALYQKLVEAASAVMRSDFASMQMLYPERGSGGELRLLGSQGFPPEAVQFWQWVRTDSNCTCGIALRTGTRVIEPDVANSRIMAGTRDQAALLQNGILAAQSTPLFSRGGRLLGMITTHWRTPHQPEERDLRLLDVLARQAADLVERKQAEEALRNQTERLRLLWEAATTLLTADDPDAMLRGLLTKIGPHLGVDVYFNYLVNDARDALRLASCDGIPVEEARKISRLEFGQAICGTVALHRQPIVANRIQQSDDPKADLVKSFGIQAYACNPLMTGNVLLGTLSFASRTKDRFNLDEVAFLKTISHYVTVAYERLRLLNELREADTRKDEFLATLAHELRNRWPPFATPCRCCASRVRTSQNFAGAGM
jgi:PAS domain S-box-containing protein